MAIKGKGVIQVAPANSQVANTALWVCVACHTPNPTANQVGPAVPRNLVKCCPPPTLPFCTPDATGMLNLQPTHC